MNEHNFSNLNSSAFEGCLREIVGERKPSGREMLKALSIVATIYNEDSLNLVNEATTSQASAEVAIRRADILFAAWEREILSLQAAIRKLPRK